MTRRVQVNKVINEENLYSADTAAGTGRANFAMYIVVTAGASDIALLYTEIIITRQ